MRDSIQRNEIPRCFGRVPFAQGPLLQPPPNYEIVANLRKADKKSNISPLLTNGARRYTNSARASHRRKVGKSLAFDADYTLVI